MPLPRPGMSLVVHHNVTYQGEMIHVHPVVVSLVGGCTVVSGTSWVDTCGVNESLVGALSKVV